jgi:hypothetical protein
MPITTHAGTEAKLNVEPDSVAALVGIEPATWTRA